MSGTNESDYEDDDDKHNAKVDDDGDDDDEDEVGDDYDDDYDNDCDDDGDYDDYDDDDNDSDDDDVGDADNKKLERERKISAKIADFFSGVYNVPYVVYCCTEKKLSKLFDHHYEELGMNTRHIVKHFMFQIATTVKVS